MTQVDPYKLMRNSATLDALRQHQRAVRAAAQPWLVIALVSCVGQISLFLFELFHSSLREFALLSSLLMLIFGASLAIAGLRAWLFRRAHRFVSPETRSVRWL